MRIRAVHRVASTQTIITVDYIPYAEIDETLDAIAKAKNMERKNLEPILDAGKPVFTWSKPHPGQVEIETEYRYVH